MKLTEIASAIKTTLTNTNPDELTDFTKLTRSQVYHCICALLDVLIQFLESLSSRFDPIAEILRGAHKQLEKLKKDSAEFRKEEDAFETVHYCKHTVAAHDVTRCCHNHHNKTKKELDRVKEENRVLRIEIDESNHLLEQKEKEYQNKLAKLENENSQLKKKGQARDLDLDYKTSHWPSSMSRYPEGTTYRNGRNKDYEKRMKQEANEDKSDQEQNSQEQDDPKRGGQSGHKGYSGRLLDGVEATQVIKLYPDNIPGEDRDQYEWEVSGQHFTVGIKFEAVITEFDQMMTKIKGNRSSLITKSGVFPPQAKSEITYDSSFIWLVETYYTIGLMGMGRIAQIIRNQFGVTMSKSTVNNILKKAGKNLREASHCIAAVMKTEGLNPECVYTADETKLTVGKTTYYDHVLIGNHFALHTISETRGLKGVFKSGVLNTYQGWLVTDFYGMYKKRDWQSAFDRAHLSRELTRAAKLDPDCEWIKIMQEFFYQSYKAYHKALDSQTPVPEEELGKLDQLYDQALEKGKKEQDQMYGATQSLLYRFRDFKDGIIACLYNTDIFLTSNAAERQCRQIKRRLDVSGHFESLLGAENYAAALSVIETAKLQNLNTIDALQQILGGNIDYLVTGIRDDSITMLTEPVMTTERDKSKK